MWHVDAHAHVQHWIKFLEEEVYGHPLEPDDYIFPVSGITNFFDVIFIWLLTRVH